MAGARDCTYVGYTGLWPPSPLRPMTRRSLGSSTILVLQALARGFRYGFDVMDATELPSGTVRITSTFADGSTGLKTVAFGGSPSMNTDQTNTGTEFTNALSWFSASNKHRIKLTSELRREAFTLNQQTNLLARSPSTR